MSKHLKRKNSGLLYEFLVRTISRYLVEGNTKKSHQALRILRHHFRPGTELYKEFRLINALVRTTVSTESVANRILSEARMACKGHDMGVLEHQKQSLVRDIMGTLHEEDFFDQQVGEYRAYATAQVLLNEWRNTPADAGNIGTVAQFEDALVRWLTCPKPEPTVELMNNETHGTNRILMRVMMKKLNEKYGDALTGEQRTLLKSYAFANVKDNPSIIRTRLEETRNRIVSEIDAYASGHKDQQVILEKLGTAKERILQESLEKVDDDTVTRFMTYIKLESELKSEDD